MGAGLAVGLAAVATGLAVGGGAVAAAASARGLVVGSGGAGGVFGTLSEAFGQRRLGYVALEEALDGGEVAHVLVGDEGDGYAVALCACGAADAVYVVFGVVGYVVVDDAEDVVDVDAAGHDVGGYEHGDLSGLEAVHDVVAFGLGEVGVHGGAVDVHLAQFACDVLDLVFLA